MSQKPLSSNTKQTTIDRERILLLLKTGIEVGAYRFSRQTALTWLAAYPGDLEVNLWYVKSLLKEERFDQAVPVLDKIIEYDPEYLDALQTADHLYADRDPQKCRMMRGMVQAMGGIPSNANGLPSWAPSLYLVRMAMQKHEYEKAIGLVLKLLADVDNPILAGIYHLEITAITGDAKTTFNLAKLYHERWTNCLQINLILAKALMQSGKEDEAVSLLHVCASQDLAGQVPTRMWSENFEFKPLYPEKMVIPATFAIPAEVAGPLGMNALSAGSSHNVTVTRMPASEVRSYDGYKVKQESALGKEFSGEEEVKPVKIKDEVFLNIEKEFKKVAEHLKSAEALQKDSRFPAYVILSTKSGLEKQYGTQNGQVIISELDKLAQSIRNRNGWSSIVFLPDDLEICGKYGITPVDAIDPWKIKLALTDLDNALEKKGEMIGCVLIAGGDKVVPFHRLPNPTDDEDAEIPSDNPYGTLDSNYFVSDWPVGRLPGEEGNDAGLLLEEIRNTTQYHTDEIDAQTWINKIIRLLFFWDKSWATQFGNMGCSAAVWRRSSIAAFRPLGEARNLAISPEGSASSLDLKKMVNAPFAYFNLHGLSDGSDWYGQKDPADNSLGSDYPVAVKAADIGKLSGFSRIVYTEACYGGHVFEKKEPESMALSMLGLGVMGLIGSTTISYGSVSTPLIGADLLGNLVMKYLKEGKSLGTAFTTARLDFVNEMNRRQGYLDGEDQKTLISFVLFGDPLVAYDPYSAMKKTINREAAHPETKTVSDYSEIGGKSVQISQEVLAQAKLMVKDYLPGIEYAEIRVSRQVIHGNGGSHHVSSRSSKQTNHVVVTFSKQINSAEKSHRQYARVTMDGRGKMLKLAVSR